MTRESIHVSKELKRQLISIELIALNEVRRLARKVLREHPKECHEFVMGMGLWSVYGPPPHSLEICVPGGGDGWCIKRKYMQPLTEFINEWDEYLKLTGTPMRFTAEGREVHDW